MGRKGETSRRSRATELEWLEWLEWLGIVRAFVSNDGESNQSPRVSQRWWQNGFSKHIVPGVHFLFSSRCLGLTYKSNSAFPYLSLIWRV